MFSNWTTTTRRPTRGEKTIQNNFEEKEEGRRTLLLLLCTARRRTRSIFLCAQAGGFFKEKTIRGFVAEQGQPRASVRGLRVRRDLRSRVKCKIDKDNNRVGN